MNIEEARLYLEHTSKEDFNLEEHQKENRYQAIQVVLKEIERLNSIVEWQQNKIAKLNSENVCLKAEIELYKDGYEIVKDSDK